VCDLPREWLQFRALWRELAQKADALADQFECLQLNEHQQTTVEGLYAAGDLVRGLNQINVAQAEGAIAATDIYNRLRGAA
jgi:thioredoxin reductase (NADPH)